jgi:hypothetical protein
LRNEEAGKLLCSADDLAYGTALLDGTTVGNMEQRVAYPNCFWEGAAPSTCFGDGRGREGRRGRRGKVPRLSTMTPWWIVRMGQHPHHLTPGRRVFPENGIPAGGIYCGRCELDSCVTYQESGCGLIDKFSRLLTVRGLARRSFCFYGICAAVPRMVVEEGRGALVMMLATD